MEDELRNSTSPNKQESWRRLGEAPLPLTRYLRLQLFVTAQGLFSARRLSLGVSLWGPGLGAGGHRL